MPEKDLVKKAKMPVGKRMKQRLDNWLNEYVNVPLAKRGHEDTGAAISAALSAGGELMIPDDLADAAMAMIPGARLLKAGKKGMKAIKQAPTLDYAAIDKAEKAADKAKRAVSERTAGTLKYAGDKGPITYKQPRRLSDDDLREMEAARAERKRKRLGFKEE